MIMTARSTWVGLVALAVGFLLTWVIHAAVGRGDHEAAQREFAHRAAEASSYLGQRFEAYEQVLRSGATLFELKAPVTRDDWRVFVSRLRIDQDYPGTLGVGYAAWLEPDAVEGYVASVRREGYPEFEVRPAGQRANYTAIQYLEPFNERNRRAFGYDMFSEPTRHAAMQRAAETGEPALSGKVILLQETDVDPQNGVLLYFPVYAAKADPRQEAAGRRTLRGFVYSPLRMNDLMAGVLGDAFADLSLAIYDGSQVDASHLLFRSAAPQAAPDAVLRTRMSMNLAGQAWTLDVSAASGYWLASGRANLVLYTGSAITILVAMLLWGLASGREGARLLAERMTRAYREAQLTQRAILDSVADGVLTVGPDGSVTSANPAAEVLFGAEESLLVGVPVTELIPDHPPLAETRLDDPAVRFSERQGRSADGRRFAVELSISPFEGAGAGTGFVESVRDISGRKQAEALLAEANGLRQSIVDHAPFCIVATDAAGVVTEMNPAAERLLMSHRDECIGNISLHRIVELFDPDGDDPGAGCPDPGSRLDKVLDGVAHGAVDEREASYVRGDGTRVLVNQVITALRSADGALSGYLAIAYDITEKKRAEDYIRHLAHHDALTELPNRALFKDRLDLAIAQARRSSRSVGVIMVDLDHFKRINDSLGHHVGDDLLVQITARLRSCVRESDTVARMGGDEFVIVLPELHGAEDAVRVARLIVDVITKPVRLTRHELHVTPSVGVCLYPQDGKDSMTLLKNADTAMYHAKEQGRNRFSLFSFDMLRLSEDRMKLESALRRAVSEKRLQTYLQPIVSAATGRVTGMEALLRWPTDDGFISPDEFVPIAEDTGLISRIGEDMLASACHHALDVGLQLGRPVTLAVNVSPQQFHHQDLAAAIRSTLESTGFPARWLTVEVTERVLVRDPVEAAATLELLRDLGVGVAIDDFGTGYSSLAYISKFPLNKLKIDRSFVRDLGSDSADTAVINAVIAMGHSLGLTIVAEGVESAAQLEHLRKQGCDEVQGFLFSPAVPVSDFVATVRRLEAREQSRPQSAAAHEVF